MKKSLATFLLLMVAALQPAGIVRAQSSVTVTVNGSPVSFDQPPVERAGRVYVPLRGVFERLGASVVYENGLINATRGSTTVQLTIGKNVAMVGGQQEQLDSPPFIIGARTLVPLRFVAQALGAVVNYDEASQTVAITQPNAQPAEVITPVPSAPPPVLAWTLVRVEPPPDVTVNGLRPELSATFPRDVQADSVRIRLDDRDVTANAYISARSFVFDPAFDIPPGPHHIEIAGRLAGGRRFASSWTFANQPVPQANFLRGLSPHNGARVGYRFVVRGMTRPGSHVHLVATSNATTPFGEVSTSSAVVDVVAAPDGSFASQLFVPQQGALIDVRVQSRAPDGTTAVATLRLLP